jgi:hypothetical protein
VVVDKSELMRNNQLCFFVTCQSYLYVFVYSFHLVLHFCCIKCLLLKALLYTGAFLFRRNNSPSFLTVFFFDLANFLAHAYFVIYKPNALAYYFSASKYNIPFFIRSDLKLLVLGIRYHFP